MSDTMNNEKRRAADIAYVDEHRDELLKKYKEQAIIVKNRKVVRVFDSINDAATSARNEFGDDVYLICQMRRVEPKSSNPETFFRHDITVIPHKTEIEINLFRVVLSNDK